MKFTSQLGKIINGKYRLVKILGEGGWGVTYLAEELQSRQQIALKMLALKGLKDWKQIELFEREARVLQSLEHPAIPRYIEYFTVDTADNRYFYLAQELAPEKSLSKWIKDGWRATETEVKQIAYQLLEILVYLHSQKPPIIHRDLKPDNIIRQADGKIFLVDFGAVKNTYYSTLTGSSTVIGTYGYLAPEQFYGKATPASDLYSLGATILYLLTHISPTELSADGLSIQFRDRVNISDNFANWLETIIEPEVEKRFDSAKQALAVLKDNKSKKHSFKVNSFNYRKALLYSSIFIFGVLMLLNYYKWGILSNLGVVPEDICEPEIMTNYLIKGGNPNARRTPFWDRSYSVTDCFADIDDRKLISSPQTALILFKHRAKFDRINEQKFTLELLAKSKEITLLLAEHGANLHTIDSDGNTLLHITQDKEVALLAIERGIDVNAKNQEGNTPLHYVNEPEMALLLLEKGADLNKTNNRGKTPLQFTKVNRNYQVIKILNYHQNKIDNNDNKVDD